MVPVLDGFALCVSSLGFRDHEDRTRDDVDESGSEQSSLTLLTLLSSIHQSSLPADHAFYASFHV